MSSFHWFEGPRRRRDHDGSSPTLGEDLDPRAVSQSIGVTYHPMSRSTLATVTTTERGGHRRWDRRNGTLILEVGSDTLRGLDMSQVLRVLLRATLDDLEL